MGYQVRCVIESPCIKFCPGFGSANYLQKTFRKSLTIPEHTMIIPKRFNHSIAYNHDCSENGKYTNFDQVTVLIPGVANLGQLDDFIGTRTPTHMVEFHVPILPFVTLVQVIIGSLPLRED